MAGAQAGAIDLAGLISAGQQQGRDIEKTLADLQISTGNINDAGAAAVQGAKDKAAAEAEVITLQGEKRLAQEAAAKNVLSITGMNSEASDSVFRLLAGRINAESEAARGSLDQINKKRSVGITDDIVEWIGNQFTLPTDIAIHNARIDKIALDEERLSKLQQASKEQIALLASAESGTSTAIVALQAKARLAQGADEVARAQYEMQRMGLSVLSARSALNSQQFSIAATLFQAGNAEQQLQLSRAANARAAEAHALQKQVTEFHIKALKEDDEGKAAIVGQWNKVRATFGMGDRPASWIEWKNLPKAQQDEWLKIMADPDVANGRLANDPASAFIRAKGLNLMISGGAEFTKNQIEGAYKQALTDPLWKSFTPEQQREKVNKALEATIKAQSANVPEQGSLLSVGSLASTLKIPVISDGVGKLFVDELKPMAADPTYNTKPADFMATGIKLVQAGKMDVTTAAQQIAVTFKAAAQDNAETKNFRRFAINGKIAEHYNTVLQTSFGFGAMTKIDMTNPASVENAMIRMMTTQRRAPSTEFDTGAR